MRILITAGGTSEKIDEVRKITNMSTGKLGALIANSLIERTSGQASITYVCGSGAVKPKSAAIIEADSVSGLEKTIEDLFREKYDAVIHSMAVSDYMIDRVTAANGESLANSKKISSNTDGIIIYMKKAPKIIKMFKELQPETVLVGFKLLVGVSESELVKTGHNLLIKNECDFVLANDLNLIDENRHVGLLIKPDSSYEKCFTKQEIADAVTDNVLKKIKEKNSKG